ncbi:MAG: type II toxin-antitoxin system VapC family toxin [Holophagales bacterium]|nr:type II toxin-antitoxin system VapC family toxin [Holophagales bacterium]
MATRLLLDTHALLWWLAADDRLPDPIRLRIENPANVVMASAVSAWEIAIKSKLGKLEAPTDLLEAGEATGLHWVSIEPVEAQEAGRLPMHHRDPFDRLLVAQAKARSAGIVSRDSRLDPYGVDRLWG